MKKNLLLFVSVICFGTTVSAQITFQRVVGIDNQHQELGESLIQMPDGGYIIAGSTFEDATSLTDAMIVKTDATGIPQWNKRFGTAAGSDMFVSAFRASDGSLYFAGTRENVGTTYQDIYVVKTDASGNTAWEKTFNMPSQEYAVEIADGGNGNVVIVTDMATVIKLDANGTLLWQKVYDDSNLSDIILTSDGGYMIAGNANGFPQLIKTDSDGVPLWSKTYGQFFGNEMAKQVIEAPDGSFYLAIAKRYLYPFDADENIVLLKTNSTGDQQWCKAYFQDYNYIDLFDMILTNDGGVAICGRSAPFTGVALKVSSSGAVQWDAKYGANESMTSDDVHAIIQTADGGFALTGLSYSFGNTNSKDDFYLIKADASGQTGGCFEDPVNYNDSVLVFTTSTVTQTTSNGTFVEAIVSSTLTAATLFTNLACAVTAGPIQADFTAGPLTIIQGQTVDFTDLSSNFPTGWNWTFTGGLPDASTAQNPSGIVYNGLGCFAVSLTATNSTSTDTETKTCYIHVIQDLSTSFQRSIGIDTLWQEVGESLIQMPDGGYIIAGSTFQDATSRTDAMIVKTDATGIPQWNKRFGTAAGSDMFVSAFRASDGSLYFAGTRENVGTTYQDIYVVKTDASGNTAWEKTFNMPSQEYAVEIADGGNGNVVIVTDMATVIKLDANGTLLWQKVYDDSNLSDIILTSDGGYMIAGNANGFPQLIKTDSDGVPLWSKTYGQFFGNEMAKQVIEAPDGSFYLAIAKRYLYPFDADENIVLLKTNSTGDQQWCKAYFQDYNYIDLFDMILTNDGGVAICGRSAPFTGVALKVSSSGAVQWDAKYGANESMTSDDVHAIIQTADGGFALTGLSYSFGNTNSKDDFYLIKTNASGQTGGCFEDPVNYNDSALVFTTSIVTQTTSNGTFVEATVSSSLTPAELFTNLACAPQAPGTYCLIQGSSYGTTEGDYIEGVILGDISNPNSGSLGGPYYMDFSSAMYTTLTKEAGYGVSIKSGAWPAGFPDRYAAWIDYNGDADFDDTGEKLGEFLSSAPNATQVINFTVPANAVIGTTRLRVRGVWSGTANIDPCDTYDYGETEDYGIIIEDPIVVEECPGVTHSDFGTSNGDYINGVLLEGISNLESGSNVGPFYTDYSATMSASLTREISYSLDVLSGNWLSGSANTYAAWIDYNNDDDFEDAGEKVGEFVSSAPNTMETIHFTVPASATAGETRMRVRGVYSGSASIDPCYEYSYGETEDYKIVILVPVIPVYCSLTISSAGTTEGDYINGVSLESINNQNSGSMDGPFYTDYYNSLSTGLNQNTNYNLTIESGNWPGDYADYYAAWIDYNRDGDFDDTHEKLGEFLSTAPNTEQTISFSVPNGISTGATRMRIRGVWAAEAGIDPCLDYNYGETEDYKVIIQEQILALSVVETNALTIYPNPGNGDLFHFGETGGQKPGARDEF